MDAHFTVSFQIQHLRRTCALRMVGSGQKWQEVVAVALTADTLTTDERLAELAAILASAIARTNPMEKNENSPLDGDSSLDILALRRRRRRQVQNRIGDDA